MPDYVIDVHELSSEYLEGRSAGTVLREIDS